MIICNLFSEKNVSIKSDQNEYSIGINVWLEIAIYYVFRGVKKVFGLLYCFDCNNVSKSW